MTAVTPIRGVKLTAKQVVREKFRAAALASINSLLLTEGVTPTALAAKMNKPAKCVKQWLDGTREMKNRQLIAMLTALKVDEIVVGFGISTSDATRPTLRTQSTTTINDPSLRVNGSN